MKERLLAPALATVSIDLRRALLGKRGIPILLLGTCAPLLMLTAGQLLKGEAHGQLVAQYAVVFRHFVLSGCLFWGTAWCFSNLFRAEVVERSLHYFFLTPVRRDAITLGKYITGVLATWIVFVPSTVLAYVFLLGQGGPAAKYLASPHGLGSLLAYAGITLLACVAYGAVFLALGLVAKSPFVPIVAVWLFESASVFLPTFLKRLTMIHYLDSLMPVPATFGVFALLAEPEPLALAVLLPLALSVAILLYAAHRVRRMEISYGVE